MAIILGIFTKLDSGAFTGAPQDPQRRRGIHHRPGRQAIRQRARSSGLCRTALRGRGWLEPGHEVERRDLPEPQDRDPRIRAELGSLPPRQARTAGRRRRHPHRPVGAARPVTTTAPPRAAAAGLFLFDLGSIPPPMFRTGAACPFRIRLVGLPIMPYRTRPPQGCAVPSILPAQGARMRAPVIIHARQNRLPHAQLRGDSDVLDPARPGPARASLVFQQRKRR
jgi:hypothetical protein